MYKRGAKGWAKHLDFIILDIICLVISLILAYMIRFGVDYSLHVVYKFLIGVLVPMDFLVILLIDTMKDVLRRGYYREFIVTLYQSLTILFVTSTFLFSTQDGNTYSRITIYLMIIIYAVIAYICRILWKKHILKHLNEKRSNALVIMADENEAANIIEGIINNNYGHHKIVGVVTENPEKVGQSINNIPIVSSYENIVEYVTKNWIDEILIAISSDNFISNEILDELNMMGVTVHLCTSNLMSRAGVKQCVSNIGGLLVVSSSMNYMTPKQYYLKRAMDIAGGIAGCIITGFLYVILAPMIKIASPGPAFFSQERIGRNGRPFKIYKFRSMYLDAEQRKAELMEQNRLNNNLMFKMDFDPRVIGNKIDDNGKQKTGIGEFIRKYSLDEFPQFFNVLKGDMSMVGTRPPLPDEYEDYSAKHKARLAVKPGITGLWQVSGRSNILDFDKVVQLDTEYINNWSIGMDIKIILMTFKAVFSKEGSM